VLSQPSIETIFQKFVTVRLHTDRVPAGVNQVPDAEESMEFLRQKFKNVARPYYVIVKPKGNVLERIGYYKKGVIPSTEEFAGFLNRALAAAK
jgi:hypothetical protein